MSATISSRRSGGCKVFELFLLRHGESEGVAQRFLQGRTDTRLTDAGRAQAGQLAAFWRSENRSFDWAVCSPLMRARETAEIVCAGLGIESLRPDPDWMERDFGEGEGQNYEVIELWYNDRPRPAAFEPIYNTGESEWDQHVRAARAMGRVVCDLLSREAGSALVVAHGSIIGAALHVLLGQFPTGRMRPPEWALDPCGYARLVYQAAVGRWSVSSFNDARYLCSPGR